MARPLRIEIEDGVYHVTTRGWERRKIVRCDRGREDWLKLLDQVVTRCGWRVFAWVFGETVVLQRAKNLPASASDHEYRHATRAPRREVAD